MAQISTCNITDAMVIRQPQTIPDDGEYHCSFCGKKAGRGSFWNGPHQTVVLCTKCLDNGHIIGALVGDAILDDYAHTDKMVLDDVDKHLKQLTTDTYKAILLRLLYRRGCKS